MVNKGESDVVADILASVAREDEFRARAEEATASLLRRNMARLRGLAILQGSHCVSFTLEYAFNFTPGKEAIDAQIAISASATESSSHPL